MSSRECQARRGKKGLPMPRNTDTQKGLPALGDRLKEARERAGLTQRQVGSTLGISNVSRWEAGSHRMYVNDLLRLAVLYEVGSLDEMLGPFIDLLPESERPHRPAADDVPLTRGEVFEWIGELSDASRAELLEVMDRRRRTQNRERRGSRGKEQRGAS